MYKVIHQFADMQDGNYVYAIGDAYPKEGSNPSEKRIAELAGNENKIGQPLIELVEEKPKPKKRKKS